METHFNYTPADYLAANALNARSVYFGRKGVRALVLLWLFYFCASMALTSKWTLSDTAMLAGATALGSVLIAALLIGVNRLLLPRRSKRLFLQQKSLQGQFSARWNANHIEFSSPSGDGRHPWHHFIKAVENDKVLMLYQSDLMYNMIPKRALDAAMIADIRDALLENNVPLNGQ